MLFRSEAQTLLEMPNVVVTQHAAFNTSEAIQRINSTTTENIIKFWYGDTPNRVTSLASSGKLVIVRHTESEWNALGKWTGISDIHLSGKGHHQAAEIGEKLAGIPFNYAYTSQQMRSRETL